MGSFSSSPSNSGGTAIPKPAHDNAATTHIVQTNSTNICTSFYFDNENRENQEVFSVAESFLEKNYGPGTLEDGPCPSKFNGR